jgi:hypothetical protein
MIWRNIKAVETKIANNELTDRKGFNTSWSTLSLWPFPLVQWQK